MTFQDLLGGQRLLVAIDPEPAGGAFNMAFDDWLLDNAASPVLRIYSWKRPTLSIGFSQKSDWIDWKAVASEGVDVVRRPTGGRALYHDRELTYSVILPEVKQSVAACYEAITTWLAEGLRRMGFPVESATYSSSSKGQPGCYNLVQRGELLLAGQKLVGSAQARRAERLLQHGVIPFDVNHRRLQRLIPGQTPYNGLGREVDAGGLAASLTVATQISTARIDTQAIHSLAYRYVLEESSAIRNASLEREFIEMQQTGSVPDTSR